MGQGYRLKALAALLLLYEAAFARAGQDVGERSTAQAAWFSLTRRPALPPGVRIAILRAYSELENPRCQQIFFDFRDPSGRTLQERLDSLGETGQSYLSWMLLYEGTQRGSCQSPETLARTAPGSRVVFFCGPKFASLIRREPSTLWLAILHEELHSLGLGENPPASGEISRKIAERCR